MFPKSCLKVATEVFILQSVVFLKCPLSNVVKYFCDFSSKKQLLPKPFKKAQFGHTD